MTEKPTRENLEKQVSALTREREELTLMLDAARAIPLAKTFAESARRIYDSCKRLTGATCGYVALMSEDGRRNELLFLDDGGLSCSVDPELPMPIRGLRAEAYSAEDVVYTNAFQETEWTAFLPIGHVGLQNVMFAPLCFGDKPVGVIGLANKPAGFTEHDKEIAKAFGDIAALALKHAKNRESLRRSEENYRSIFENAVVGFYQSSPQGRFISVNPAFAQMLGYASPDDIVSRISDIADQYYVDAEDRRRFMKILHEHGRIENFEFKVRRRDGSEIWVSNSTRACFREGKVVHYEGAVIDITRRKRAEAALRKSEEKFRSMMESMKDPAFICSPDHCVEYMNPRMISKIGRDATGERCHKAIYDNDERCAWCAADQVREGEHVEYELLDPADKRHYAVLNSPIYRGDGSISKLTIFRDITESKATEAQLRHSRKMESIGALAGGVAHDFNNILYVIVGNAELALEEIPEWNPVYANVKEVKAAGLRAAGIVKQLLSFSRMADQELRSANVAGLVQGALRLLRASLPAGIDIRTRLPEDDLVVHADASQIEQVLMNICVNAAQAMEETGGVLDIIVEKAAMTEKGGVNRIDIPPGDYASILVRDTGPGIAPDIIDHIFDPYFTTREIGKGSGMGLAVAHGIIRNHGGVITADNRPGKGAAFTVLLPAVGGQSHADENGAEDIPVGGERILFVDDEAAIAKMAQQMLTRLGYAVTAETGAADALALFRSSPYDFDLVITDMTMPQMTGVQFAEKIMAIRKDIPVIICTGHSALIDENKAKKLGVAAFAMKPIARQEIARTIRQALDAGGSA